MNRWWLVSTALVGGIALIGAGTRSVIESPVRPATIRFDPAGSGEYGAPRGGHFHAGVDLVTREGQQVRSPIEGRITRVARPYENSFLSGVEIEGSGKYAGYQIRMFYFAPNLTKIGDKVRRGERIGRMQRVSLHYGRPDMKDHLHLEVRRQGVLVNPLPLIS